MSYVLGLFILPPFLIFGLYHLTLWFRFPGMSRRSFWRRVAWSSALAHLLFALGILSVAYMDYRSTTNLFDRDTGFAVFLTTSRDVLQVLLVFDTLAAVALVGLLAVMDAAGAGTGVVMGLGAGVVLVLGTFQWYWLGGALGAILERVWSGLKTEDDDGPDWL